ncbi:sialidase family protein [Halosimplex amylolyticum]|uniref:sialidase family protein n=1 Tax=Halosimplex amylolyticum TaxID=3396616 RepID=UPI003F55BF19
MASPTAETHSLQDVTHSVVHRNPDEFAAWPFNGGMWLLGDEEVAVGFFAHDCDYAVESHLNHRRISTYGEIRLSRTHNGGNTWESPEVVGRFPDISEQVLHGRTVEVDSVDLSDPETLLMAWAAPDFWAEWSEPWIRLSEDGGHTWSDPMGLPTFHHEGVQGRPSTFVRDDGTVLLFGSAISETSPSPRASVYASFDGRANWTFLSYLTPQAEYATICPTAVQRDDGTLVATVRCNPAWDALWTECYISEDQGQTWTFRSRVTDHGAPGQLLRLSDGRLLYVYGYRHPPYGVRAVVSDDGGSTWGPKFVVRDDGGCPDLGYPRAVEVEPGRVLTAYYFTEEDPTIPMNGGVRYVAATVFDVPES